MNNYNTNVNQDFRYNQPTPSNINNNHQWNNNGNNFQNRPPTYIFPPQNINFHNNQNQSQNTRPHFNHNMCPPSNNSNTHTQQFQNLNNDIFNNRNNYSKISQPNDFKNELKYLIETYSENKECPLSPIKLEIFYILYYNYFLDIFLILFTLYSFFTLITLNSLLLQSYYLKILNC